MRCFIFFIIVTFTHIVTFAQQGEGENLIMLKIENSELKSAIQQIVDYEKECIYFYDTIGFYLYIDETTNSPGDYSVRFVSTNYRTIHSTYPTLGYFYYNKHLFVVYGNSFLNLFIRTNHKKWFEYWKPNSKEIFILDDSHSEFQYWYVDNKLHLGEIYGCEKKSEKINSDNSQKTIKESN